MMYEYFIGQFYFVTRKALGECRPPPSLLTLKAFPDPDQDIDQYQNLIICRWSPKAGSVKI